MPDQKLKEEIDRLISSGEIQYESGLIGCCIKYYLKFPNDSHKYCYKNDNIISNTLNKKVLSHLYTMSSKRLNKKQQVYHSTMLILKREMVMSGYPNLKDTEHGLLKKSSRPYNYDLQKVKNTKQWF